MKGGEPLIIALSPTSLFAIGIGCNMTDPEYKYQSSQPERLPRSMSNELRYRTRILACALAGLLLTPATPLAWIMFAVIFQDGSEERRSGINIILKMGLIVLSAATTIGTSNFTNLIMRQVSILYFARETPIAPFTPAHIFMITALMLYPCAPHRLSTEFKGLCYVKSYTGLYRGKLFFLVSSILITAAYISAPFKPADANLSLDTFFFLFTVMIFSSSMIVGILTFYLERYRNRTES